MGNKPRMQPPQCLGRLVRDTPKGVWRLPFEGSNESFHIPLRCEKPAVGGPEGLCSACLLRRTATEAMVARMTGMSVKGGTHPSFLHGKVGEPIPFWSHLYGGSWFRLKMEAGYRVSEENMGRAKRAAAAAAAGSGAPEPEPEPIPKGLKGRGNAGSKVSATVQTKIVFPDVATVETSKTVPVPKPPPAPVAVGVAAATAPKAKKSVKKVGGGGAAVAAAAAIPLPLEPATALCRKPRDVEPVEDLVIIAVEPYVFEGKECYWDPETKVVYDKLFAVVKTL